MASSQTKICFPTPKAPVDCYRLVIKMAPAQIGYLVMVFEAYDFIGIPRTIDRKNGIVEILASPDFADDARRVIESLSADIPSLEIITE